MPCSPWNSVGIDMTMRLGQETLDAEGEDLAHAEREDDSYGHEKGRLLQDFDGHSDQDQPQRRLSKPPSNRLWRAGWIAGLFVVIATSIIIFLILRRDHGATREAVVTNDYLLDPQWDASSPPQRREYLWTISDVIHNPDGVFRPMIVVNNQYPGPLIEANEGDTIVVHVNNEPSTRHRYTGMASTRMVHHIWMGPLEYLSVRFRRAAAFLTNLP